MLISSMKSGLRGVSSAGEMSSVMTWSSSGFSLDSGLENRNSLNYYVRLERISMALWVCSLVSFAISGWLYDCGLKQILMRSFKISVFAINLKCFLFLLFCDFIVLPLHFIHYIVHLQETHCIEALCCEHLVKVDSFNTVIGRSPSALFSLYLLPSIFSK